MKDKENNNYYDKVSETYEIEEARKRKLIRRKLKYVAIVTIIVGAFIYLCYQYLFEIKSIEITGNSHYTTEEISEAFGVSVGEKLFSYSRSEKEKQILEKYPYISECTIRRTLPEKVTVTVKERTAAMYTYISGKYVIFDDEGIVLEITETRAENLLPIKFNENIIRKCIPGEKIVFADEKTTIGLKRVYSSVVSSEIRPKIKYVTVESRFDYYLQYEEKYNVYLGDSNDCPEKLLFLQGIITKLYEEDEGTIDVSEVKKGAFIKK